MVGRRKVDESYQDQQSVMVAGFPLARHGV